jgi:PHS family inorganic phosphate transporter-like MFS transporter
MLNYLYLAAKPDNNTTCTMPALITGATPSFRPETLTLQNHVVTTYTLESNKVVMATLDKNVVTTLTQVLAAPTSLATATQVAELPSWNQDAGNPCATIKDVLWTSAIHTLELSSVAALVGALVCIVIINYIPRRRLLAITSAGLALLLFASGVAVWKTAETEYHKVTMVFFALIQFLLNVGPNTVVFIIAAESFPTVFRGTFYGVAAASGKIGALTIRVVVQKTYNHKLPTMGLFFGFCVASLLMVVISLVDGFLVDVQKADRPLADVEKRPRFWWPKQLKNKTLEEIAPNPRHDAENSRSSWHGAGRL